ncbi:exodeoxyribonuclease VII large subunit [Pollutimonas harenae]|uniref:Exodeoxyribonuclease 7 large subunit n=1 Tax=Pollutimonas harenae TaxID=657015 RepID=A0A853GX18_9BURK|nr:exodeoxyribonuclease VII large subunit [Pollutimonas harenae]TEA71562.1 exodeoxyribonuclease VII large subunit [Pollutimonas harenae]
MQPDTDGVLTVSQLNRRVGDLLSGYFSRIWVRGEVSNFTQAASGHWYFSVKDEGAAVRAVMFRGRAQAVGFVPKPGEKFEFRVNVTLYEPRGDYQVQVESLRRAGRGDLHEAFLVLKDKLAAEGLFDPGRKRPIKALPQAIGVVTSLAAAALRDVLSALARRAPHVSVIIYPAPVQGLDAAGRLNQALQQAIQRNEVDTLLLVRGGGSLEDLWSFNDEVLARSIAASPIPIISGVGHETDFTIADFVADVRAPTPTAAAELCCRSRQSCADAVAAAVAALTARQMRNLERSSLRLDRAVALLVSPQQRLRQQGEHLQRLRQRLAQSLARPQEGRTARLAMLETRLAHARPRPAARHTDITTQLHRLAAGLERGLERRQQRLAASMQTLHALNPHNILERGYAIVRKGNGEVVKNALDLNIGESLSVELGRGSVHVNVSQTHGLL